ncbi:YeiH family protein [Ramlibacter sp. WS9]|uniref:YeiH family protein n=1 Tax=Ramlibacter sp. WS9 TaxID=1882741 RepID=UPI001141EFDF|nr:putative sulfate exporter family transporter [Ramlibacter sp. WS9]ROZ77101.1 putative sulfate exporter family transporter [Ramlibacter sp. WS9]
MRALMLRFMRAGWSQQQLIAALPGFTTCVVIALAAGYAAAQTGAPPMLCALLVGTALHYLSEEIRTAPGVVFCVRVVLRLGVGLLGARITAAEIAALGWPSALIVITAVATTLLCGLALAKRLGLSTQMGVLAGGATAICGASAALAIAAVLPKDKALERDTLAVVVLATLLSTLAMLVYPLVAQHLGLSPTAAGLFLGATIHDVAQVVVAGYTLGPEAGNTAAIVKLSRVALLAAVVAGVVCAFRNKHDRDEAQGSGELPPLVPSFLILFLLLALFQSTVGLSPRVQSSLNDLSNACLLMGVAALGMKTSFAAIARAGWRQAALMLGTTAWIGAVVLVAVAWRMH